MRFLYREDKMTLLDIIHLIFWCGTLAGWLAGVIYGCHWIDKKTDKLLDRWFASEEENEFGFVLGGNIKRDACWINYMD